ncbi:hypothetical protein AK812_SmicGene29497 [Symbiodinium microadriaticum]|uniref:Integrase catalytic domain-containing protein n=1 Tax=Symbiodinium microadriaticum TaxID=2951 RepID=A0A1Q9D1N6_SYMMI|nr:hypothetical protein AK812_SmicGene29497 [Symbiodinium microadriaticum]
MSPSATATQELLRGDVEANHGSVGGLVNGVTAAALQDGTPDSGIQAGTVSPLNSGGVVATREQVNVPMNEAIHAVVPGKGQTLPTTSVAVEDGSVHSVSASVQQGSSSLTVVRWITRLNEYLAAQGQTVIFLSIMGGFLVQKLGEMRSSIIYELKECGCLKQHGVTNDSSTKVIQEDFSMGVTSDLSLKDLLEDFGMRETSNLSLKDLLEDFGMRETSNLSLKELLEDFGMRGTSNLSPKDLLEDFGVWAMRVPNVRVIFENLSILQACRGLEVNVVRYLLALQVWLSSRSNKIEIFVHVWVQAVMRPGGEVPEPPVYTMYQPGGESEKAYILQYLVTPPKAQTAVEMVATLRQWERMLLRADNLSIAKPDPSLLVRGLNALVGDVWAKDRDVTFRTQLVKSRLGVDVSPTWESALQLHQHLRAEVSDDGTRATANATDFTYYHGRGCEISWKKGNFKVVHPVWGELRLVNAIEDKKLKELKDGVSLLKSKLEHLVHEEKLPWTTYIERYLEGDLAKDLWKALQGSFMKILSEHMLDPLCQGIRLGEGWNHLKDLPLPRRLRKRMLDSTKWVVHLPVHRDEERPKVEEYGPEFVKVTGMHEFELNLGEFGDQHVALGGSMKAMTPEKWKEHVRAGEDPGARGDRAKAAKMKYLLVAKFTIPESYVTGELEPTGSDPLDEEVGSKDLFDEEDKVSGGGDEESTVGAIGEDRDPGEAIVEHEPLDAGEEPEEADTGAGVGPIPLDVKAPKATYLLFAEPLLNDKGPTIASAIKSIVLYLQSLNIPLLRFHSDRAAQLTARPLVQWLHQQAIRTSTSTPGVPQGNGAAESAVKELKLRTRKTLSTSGLEKPFWPVAAKAVASMQRARVLRQVPKMITSFGSKVLVKKRRYAALEL